MSLFLEIQATSGAFRFALSSGFEPRLEPAWKDASEPPEVVELREVWEFPGARLVASDGEPQTFWQEWTAFLATFRVRGAGAPVSVRLVRVVGTTTQVVWTLGPPTHERFRIEQLGSRTDDVVPRATWNVLAPVTLVISAVQRFADVRGIVGWHQETSSRHDPGGLHILEWRTTISTREGISAIEKVRQFGRIQIAPFGPSYTYETNGRDGVEVVTTDADEVNQRVPTRATAVSRIRQWGIRVGTTSPGTSPTEVSYSVRTRFEEGKRSVTYRATARGPGALAWVEARRPANAVDTGEVLHEEALRYAEGTWTTKDDPADELRPWSIQTEITGGHVDFDFEPVVGGYEPVLFEGAILPWRLTVQVRAQRRGANVSRDELLLPGVLPEPWILDHNESREREPTVEKEGLDPESRVWVREASLVYWSARRPTASPLRQLEESRPVSSYFLQQGVK